MEEYSKRDSSMNISYEPSENYSHRAKNFYGANLVFKYNSCTLEWLYRKPTKIDKLKQAEKGFVLSGAKSEIPEYNSLRDKHLAGHFYNKRLRKFLVNKGFVISMITYKIQ